MKSLPQPLLNILAEWQEWRLCSTPPSLENIKVLPEGLTNQVYLLQLETGNYVLRIASVNSEQLDINREAEFNIQQTLAAEGLTAQVRYRASDNRYWIRDFIAGNSLSILDLTIPNLMVMANILKKVHQLPVIEGVSVLNIAEKAEHYWNMIAAAYGTKVLALKDGLQQLSGTPSGPLSLCHLDPTPGNWIQTNHGELLLLDWEYAAIGHPLWDIAALFQEAELSQADEQKVLVSYGVNSAQDWCLAKAQMEYMSVLWYGAQRYWSEDKLLTKLQNIRARGNC